MAREMLKISALEAWYGESHILHGVELTVQEGEVVHPLEEGAHGPVDQQEQLARQRILERLSRPLE